MIAAHGALVSVTNTEVVVRPSPLFAALSGHSAERSVAIDDIAEVHVHAGDGVSEYRVECALRSDSEHPLMLRFAPGAAEEVGELVELLELARQGKAPEVDTVEAGGSTAGVPGLSFVGFDVETANPHWGSICQIGLVKIVDGEEVERASWLCQPPEEYNFFEPGNVAIHGIRAEDVADAPGVRDRIDELVDFVGDLPLVAHNAQFDASALHSACIATGREVPPLVFACTLAQARAKKLGVRNHRLPTLAEHFGTPLDNHHDACADAAACAGIMLGLVREAGYTGSLMGFVHDSGFAMGTIEQAKVSPVVRDRSGEKRALQAERFAEGGARTVVEAAAAPRGSNQAGPQRREAGASRGESAQRRPAPWQSVATPDTVPEPNPDASPDSALFGEHVTLTGEFEPFDKGTLWNGIAELGGQVGKNVTKKTTILVVGAWNSVTSKEKRANELNEKGQGIQIWQADKLLNVLGLDETPPF
ncbi:MULTISPECIES: exonuclease domain-containing protein [unclassified Corynebacterium]|uniref:exonuclease domain-containing protein n=1 Tax=unclassified Corynebacterium TaxID=2624378 RepID=UPI0008A36847|nr:MULTISPECIES: exonuclease domain-containing protein [unclassified Corynebacterium]OFP35976.1 DNA polymerase III subunit epsilon [Corynebacterium sp. HMSC071B10]OHF36224.1 DNA polymerase III subunit epsilon [Corynebacterium sp. HMSC074A01]